MSYRAHGGYIDLPSGKVPEDPHLELTFDYEFAGKRMGEQVSLLIHSWIIEYSGNIFSRRAQYLVPRNNAVDCISQHIRHHLIAMGLDDMSCRRLMRDLEINSDKSVNYDILEFSKMVK